MMRQELTVLRADRIEIQNDPNFSYSPEDAEIGVIKWHHITQIPRDIRGKSLPLQYRRILSLGV
jgi:hypothetical protein